LSTIFSDQFFDELNRLKQAFGAEAEEFVEEWVGFHFAFVFVGLLGCPWLRTMMARIIQ
jgi:hypothetical protein